MSIRKTSFAKGEYYHIYNRGNSKQKIFLDVKDYNRFISLLEFVNNSDRVNTFNAFRDKSTHTDKNSLVAIGAYCLMSNHFHILITPIIEDGISLFMRKLSTAYVMYFNRKNKRTGGLFEGKFKAEHVATDEYLKYIFSYIHLNPVKLIQKDWKESCVRDKNKVIQFLSAYKYSSYPDFLGISRRSEQILKLEYFPEYFSNKKDFNLEILSWLSYKD